LDKALRSLIDWYDRVGVDTPDISPLPTIQKERKSLPKLKSAALGKTPAPIKSNKQKDIPLPASANIASQCKSIDELRLAMQKFDAGALSDGARQMVFSRGNPKADIMIIGEAPGRDEDIQGKPFVGRSGQLLDKMLASIGLNEESFYITNVVNWRPPKNRNPKPEEIELCRPFLEKHVELVQPKIILLVGGVSMSALTDLTGIMKHHGQWEDIKLGGLNLPAMPIYHPAFLLRQPALKKEAWRDLLNLRAKLTSIQN
jgi:DNA polymerase